VSGVPSGTAEAVIRKRARELKAPYTAVFDPPRGFEAVKCKRGYRFLYQTPEKKYSFSPGLAGLHQGRNAAIALAAALHLGRAWRPLRESLIIKGIEGASWPGRLETVRRAPRVVLDGAHNPEGARAVRSYVQDFVPKPLVLLFAVMKDKDISGLIRILFPLARKVILTRFPYHRAAEPEDILRRARRFAGRISVESDPGRAYRQALAEARRRKGSVLVTGSLFLVGEIKKMLAHRPKSPAGKNQ